MKVSRSGAVGTKSTRRRENFTGAGWTHSVVTDLPVGSVAYVFFEPGSRTYWHRHPGGQVLNVTAGEGRVRTRSGEGAVIRPGDIVFASPGEEHWHGGGPDTYMVHMTVSLGATEWLEEVDPKDYERPFD